MGQQVAWSTPDARDDPEGDAPGVEDSRYELKVSMFSIFQVPFWLTAVTANIAPP
jgi:hypothetical protein